ncbi:hypothetical protein AB204_19760, partial [Xenorhabdus khoisanae]
GRKVNGKPLSADIALNAADVGAYSKGETYSRAETDKQVNDAKTAAANANNNANGRVPAGRKVNGKPLSADIALNAADVGAYSKGETYSRGEVDSRVNDVRNSANNANNNANGRLEKSKNGADIPDKNVFINNLGLTEARQKALNAVPQGRKVNGKPLAGDVWLGAGDVGAYSKGETESRITEVKSIAHNTVSGMRLSAFRNYFWGSRDTR